MASMEQRDREKEREKEASKRNQSTPVISDKAKRARPHTPRDAQFEGDKLKGVTEDPEQEEEESEDSHSEDEIRIDPVKAQKLKSMALIKQGYLSRRHKKKLWYAWHKRYFVLREGHLVYFKSESQKMQRGYIKLTREFEVSYAGVYNAKRKGYLISLLGPNANKLTKLYVCASTQEDAAGWVEALTECIAKAPSTIYDEMNEQNISERDSFVATPIGKAIKSSNNQSTSKVNLSPAQRASTGNSIDFTIDDDLRVDELEHKGQTIKMMKDGLEGWLWKKHRKNRLWSGWHKRYFVLRGNQMKFFRNGRKTKSRGTVTFGVDCRVDFPGTVSMKRKLYVFTVFIDQGSGEYNSDSVLLLGSRSQREADTWVDTIQLAIHAHDNNRRDTSTIFSYQSDDEEYDAYDIHNDTDKTCILSHRPSVSKSKKKGMKKHGSSGRTRKRSTAEARKQAMDVAEAKAEGANLTFAFKSLPKWSGSMLGVLVCVYAITLGCELSAGQLRVVTLVLIVLVTLLPFLTAEWLKYHLAEIMKNQQQRETRQRLPRSPKRTLSTKPPQPKQQVLTMVTDEEFEEFGGISDLPCGGSSSSSSEEYDNERNESNHKKHKANSSFVEWGPCKGSEFVCRVGPDYSYNKKKERSGPGMYAPVSADLLKHKGRKIPNMAPVLDFESFSTETKKKIVERTRRCEALKEKGFHIPPFVIVNWQMPDYPPTNPLWGKKVNDGDTLMQVSSFLIEEWVLEEGEQGALGPGTSLVSKYFQSDKTSPFRERWKVITQLLNPEKCNLSKVEWALHRKFNATPFLVRPQYKFFSGTFKLTIDETDNERSCEISSMKNMATNGLFTRNEIDGRMPTVSKDDSSVDPMTPKRSSGHARGASLNFPSRAMTERKLRIGKDTESGFQSIKKALSPDLLRERRRSDGGAPANTEMFSNIAEHKDKKEHSKKTAHIPYEEMTLDCHDFNYLCRSSGSGFLTRLSGLDLNVGVIIEAREDEEMPEQAMACVRLSYMDPKKAPFVRT